MGIMVYSLFGVIQDLYHQPYPSLFWLIQNSNVTRVITLLPLKYS